jgi:hypothetical protein
MDRYDATRRVPDLPVLVATGHAPFSTTVMGELSLLVLGVALFATCFAVSLDRSWKDLRFLY